VESLSARWQKAPINDGCLMPREFVSGASLTLGVVQAVSRDTHFLSAKLVDELHVPKLALAAADNASRANPL
jgi:hypothetical protein